VACRESKDEIKSLCNLMVDLAFFHYATVAASSDKHSPLASWTSSQCTPGHYGAKGDYTPRLWDLDLLLLLLPLEFA
jgi:hypothetical protein